MNVQIYLPSCNMFIFFFFFFQGNQLKEATKINLSLSALGNVISALVSKYLLKVIHGDINPF